MNISTLYVKCEGCGYMTPVIRNDNEDDEYSGLDKLAAASFEESKRGE